MEKSSQHFSRIGFSSDSFENFEHTLGALRHLVSRPLFWSKMDADRRRSKTAASQDGVSDCGWARLGPFLAKSRAIAALQH